MVITTTSPIRRHVPLLIMENAMATRNRAFNRKGLELTHPNAAGIDIGSASQLANRRWARTSGG
jgi:hypothetical protein